jgi:hypothetical protein
MLYDSIGKKQTQHYTNTEVDRFLSALSTYRVDVGHGPGIQQHLHPCGIVAEGEQQDRRVIQLCHQHIQIEHTHYYYARNTCASSLKYNSNANKNIPQTGNATLQHCTVYRIGNARTELTALGSLPLSSSSLTDAALPERGIQCRGVSPRRSWLCTLRPRSMRLSMMAMWPEEAAACSSVAPLCGW